MAAVVAASDETNLRGETGCMRLIVQREQDCQLAEALSTDGSDIAGAVAAAACTSEGAHGGAAPLEAQLGTGFQVPSSAAAS